MNLKEEAKNELSNHIIPFWKGLIDRQQGGFYGRVDYDLQVHKNADKGCILNSRILWFFSAAAECFQDQELLNYAKQAYEFLMEKFIDDVNGGVYWSVQANGNPLDVSKHTYNLAFAIYGLSEYYKVSKDPQALKTAYALYQTIEKKCKDEYGYCDSFTRDWKIESNEKLSENGVLAKKTMNTLLHIFEAYTALYEVDRSDRVKNSLKEILNLFVNKIYNPLEKRQEVFFDEQYHSLINLHSYGHDIEASWLLDRGATLVNDEVLLIKTQMITDELAKNVYRTGFIDGYLYNECENGRNDKTCVWWVQAEAVNGFLNAYQKYPEKKQYLIAAVETFEHIKKFVIDLRKGSEWFMNVSPSGIPEKKDIVDEWKCPYHNGRMCIEIMRMI